MFSAISLGVFCREAPSTSAIMRSTNDSPGFVVIRMTIRSDSTVVPPVTELRSPPASRMTGADSPVIADSSTVAMPSTTSPSPGIVSPASTTTRSPIRSSVPGTFSSRLVASAERPSAEPFPSRRRAIVSRLVARNDSACALPRPSATASARFANSTVSQSQIAMRIENALGVTIAATVTTTDPTHTTNMTGLRSCARGSSLRNASGVDASSWRGLNAPAWTAPPARGTAAVVGLSWRSTVMTRPPQSARGPMPERT